MILEQFNLFLIIVLLLTCPFMIAFGTNNPLFYQTKYLAKVDKPTFILLHSIKSALINHGYQPGDTILGFYKMPGIIYLLNGNPGAGTLWSERTAVLNGYLLKQNRIFDERKTRIKNLFVLYRNDSPEKLFRDKFFLQVYENIRKTRHFQLIKVIPGQPGSLPNSENMYIFKLL